MELDPIFLSRVQFAFTISFHVLFPAFTVGLAAWIVVLEGLWWGTGRDVYGQLSRFWTKIFAVSFGMGVVSGIVMSFQFGTNWSVMSQQTGNVVGPLIAYEVVTAFFLEATFLGVMLFGQNRVPRGLHFFSSLMVAIGTLISTFWILSANSWLQTPGGFERGPDGVFAVVDWWQVIFTPSFPYRLAHMVTGAFLTTAFVVAAVSAWHLLKRRTVPHAQIGLSMSLGLICVLAPLQIFIGDLHGLNTLEHQPTKVAAMEGHWERQRGASLILFGLPDMEAETTHYEIAIPKLSALILTHSLDGETPGLLDVAPEDRPYAPVVFWTFRIMVGLGLVMLAIAVWSLYLRARGRLFDSPVFLRTLVACLPIGFIAILAGWFTTEIGRQPYMVYGLLRTADAATPSLSGWSVLVSLLAFIVAYGVIFPSGVYYMVRLVQGGPDTGEIRPPGLAEGRPQHQKRPLSVPEESLEPAE
ncbi:cytochrome ubiquinol oxidase subunit I [Marinivivus vitaminiproducens]|uniref:cytochrome ubiquinol oxidase subunit I n=1 Tax=Marinivivus vitaminiproducens TaxID=3035935 RepID=UPI0027A12412|nr:cytochrome ubiquinol oxidase subunit I [Geminicoccaceae bacterium SCSIO 64248]